MMNDYNNFRRRSFPRPPREVTFNQNLNEKFHNHGIGRYIIKEWNNLFVILFPNQCYLGRSYISPKDKFCQDFFKLSYDDFKNFVVLQRALGESINELFNPSIIETHSFYHHIRKELQCHLIPRYDTVRTFENIQFTDMNFGRYYMPHPKTDNVPREVAFKIKDSIRKKLEEKLK